MQFSKTTCTPLNQKWTLGMINVQDKDFKPGDKVLVLLPVPQSPLQAKFFGSYTIEKKLSDLNYIVYTPFVYNRKRTT